VWESHLVKQRAENSSPPAAVENLWMIGEYPVDALFLKISFHGDDAIFRAPHISARAFVLAFA
jgi:hypothetical protein